MRWKLVNPSLRKYYSVILFQNSQICLGPINEQNFHNITVVIITIEKHYLPTNFQGKVQIKLVKPLQKLKRESLIRIESHLPQTQSSVKVHSSNVPSGSSAAAAAELNIIDREN